MLIKMDFKIYWLAERMVPFNIGGIKDLPMNSITPWRMKVIMALGPVLKDKALRWQLEISMPMEESILF